MFESVTRLVTLKNPTFVWRGHADATWPIQASVHRKLEINPPVRAADVERSHAETIELLVQARRHRYDQLPGWEGVPDLPLLALLQHNGAATPLVDVTTDPAVALFFASQSSLDKNGREQHGLLLAIDVRPHEVGAGTPWPPRAIHLEVGEDRTWDEVIGELHRRGISLGLYSPPMVTPRIMAQRGRFIFGEAATALPYSTVPLDFGLLWNTGHLDRLFGEETKGRIPIPPVVGILVAATFKRAVRDVLASTYGLTSETLFPDFGGFAAAHGVEGPRLAERNAVPSALTLSSQESA